ncbi:MAG: hypothetical protein ACFBRM_11755 [Pikeienuella sp.]
MRRLAAALGAAVAFGLAHAAGAELLLVGSVDPGVSVQVAIEPPLSEPAILVMEPISGPAGAEEVAGPAVSATPLLAGLGVVTVAAPRRPGSYRLRLTGSGRRDVALLEVVAAPAGLSVPSVVRAALPFEVSVSAPEGAWLVIRAWPPATGEVLAERQLAGSAAVAGLVEMAAPALSGRYTMALHGPGAGERRGALLRSAGFSVDATLAFLRAPGLVTAGEGFEISRVGPGGPGHAVEIVAEAGGAVVATLSLDGHPEPRATHWLTAPAAPGRYRLRYLSRADAEVLEDVLLVVQ